MTPFIELSAGIRSIFCTASIILMIAFMINTIQAVQQRRWGYVTGSSLLFVLPYIIYQICADVSDFYLGMEMNSTVKKCSQYPYVLYILFFIILFVLSGVLFYNGVRYKKTHITPNAVKEAADHLSTGICYFNEKGYPFFVNHKMNDLVSALTDHTLTDGFELSKLIEKDNYREIDGEVYHFSLDKLTERREVFYKIIAENVTDVYMKSKELEYSNERLRKQNIQMKVYGEQIEETIRKEEIQRAKTNIHNGLNKLLLSTDKTIQSGTWQERQQMVEAWHKNILFLCLESEEQNDNPFSDLMELGRIIGLQVHIEGKVESKNKKALRLFVLCAEEAMTNAVKHANASDFYIKVKIIDDTISAVFSNNGEQPQNKITEHGGLSEIRRKTEAVHGQMNTDYAPFSLKIKIPMGDENYV